MQLYVYFKSNNIIGNKTWSYYELYFRYNLSNTCIKAKRCVFCSHVCGLLVFSHTVTNNYVLDFQFNNYISQVCVWKQFAMQNVLFQLTCLLRKIITKNSTLNISLDLLCSCLFIYEIQCLLRFIFLEKLTSKTHI